MATRGGNNARKTVDESYHDSLDDRTLSGQFNQYRTQVTPRNRAVNDSDHGAANDNQARGSDVSYRPARPQRNRGLSTSKTSRLIRGEMRKNIKKNPLRRARATRATFTVISVGLGIFYIVQFFLGLAYMISFGVLGAADITEDSSSGSIIADFGDTLIRVGRDLLSVALDLFGIDLGGIFIISFALSLLWGVVTLLTLSFIYTIQGIRPLSGRASSTKNLLFLFAIVSYIIPFLNIFPVFIFWALVVWKNPK